MGRWELMLVTKLLKQKRFIQASRTCRPKPAESLAIGEGGIKSPPPQKKINPRVTNRESAPGWNLWTK